MRTIFLTLLLLVVCVCGYEKSYKDHQVLRCQLDDNSNTFGDVLEFAEKNLIDVWATNYVAGTIDLNLSPQQMILFLTKYKGTDKMKCDIFIQDLQAAIDEESESMKKARSSEASNAFFDTYRTYPEIVTFLNGLAQNNSFLYTVVIGNSTQGTPIYGVEMNGGSGKKRQGVMPTIYFQGGQHAREWIGPATVCYILNSLVEGYVKGDPTITKMVDDIKWTFIPVINPDGYTYSRTNDRMWRKNRRNPPQGSTCWGVDTNRNWPSYWNQGGSSTNPCSDTYMGISAGSEVEVQNVMNYFQRLTNIASATDWHSYSQVYLIPWGWTTANSPTHQQMMSMGNAVCNRIREIHSTIYTPGTTAQLLYIASGSFTDWAYQIFGATYSQTIELRDTGRYGFLLPASEIVPTGQENLAGVITQAKLILGITELPFEIAIKSA